jgi:hypothetical protein
MSCLQIFTDMEIVLLSTLCIGWRYKLREIQAVREGTITAPRYHTRDVMAYQVVY